MDPIVPSFLFVGTINGSTVNRSIITFWIPGQSTKRKLCPQKKPMGPQALMVASFVGIFLSGSWASSSIERQRRSPLWAQRRWHRTQSLSSSSSTFFLTSSSRWRESGHRRAQVSLGVRAQEVSVKEKERKKQARAINGFKTTGSRLGFFSFVFLFGHAWLLLDSRKGTSFASQKERDPPWGRRPLVVSFFY